MNMQETLVTVESAKQPLELSLQGRIPDPMPEKDGDQIVPTTADKEAASKVLEPSPTSSCPEVGGTLPTSSASDSDTLADTFPSLVDAFPSLGETFPSQGETFPSQGETSSSLVDTSHLLADTTPSLVDTF